MALSEDLLLLGHGGGQSDPVDRSHQNRLLSPHQQRAETHKTQAFRIDISYTWLVGAPSTLQHPAVRINPVRLLARIASLADVSPIAGGGNCRLALTEDDKHGRDLVVDWMKELNLDVRIDVVGNIIGTWACAPGAPVMTGSHIDTVRTGGRFDGNYGVLAGLEVIQTLQEAGVTPPRALAVGIFTNEEGARFAPDMLGSLVYVGGMSVEEALDVMAIDGARFADELEKIGYNGPNPCPGPAPYAFVELHIEQGPVLESIGFRLGSVTGVQGISWQELTITGQSNHAGTTPMSMRRDAAFVAAKISVFLRDLALRYGPPQVCTVGKIDLVPNLVNVVASRATMTIDVRNTDETKLRQAEREISDFLDHIAREEDVTMSSKTLARFEPVIFDERVVDIVTDVCASFDVPSHRLPSGAGHDAQMFARVCPTAMIFVPSINGVSHNAAELTDDADLALGADVLLHTMLRLSATEFTKEGKS
jgi:N-carbamoyl-L-amino-acid hydrolase